MLTGINFSPPLYFLFNFCIQLVLPTSIEQLRIQSLVFIVIGIALSFLLTRKIFGTTPAFFATTLVASQSNLLLSQAQEARHYAMFFACGAWVLYMQCLNENGSNKNKWLTFLAHFCLCQVHYLGIIFSGLVGLSYLISNKEKPTIQRITFPISTVWIFTLTIYPLLLSKQSSHLGNWPKPNELSDLLSSYNDSILILSIMIPLISFMLMNKSKKNDVAKIFEENRYSRPMIITSILWFSVPFIFWTLSRLTSLNLFVDRYFIPKEVAIIFLIAWGFNLVILKFPNFKFKRIPIFVTLGVSIILVLISTKRAAFGLNKDTNYHHSLIIDISYPKSEQPIILESDPEYFPNGYLDRNKYRFKIRDENTRVIYQSFSSKIILVN